MRKTARERHERLTEINREATQILESEGAGPEEVFSALFANLPKLAKLFDEADRIAQEGMEEGEVAE